MLPPSVRATGILGAAGSRVARKRHLVVTHLLDLVDERLHVLEEPLELGALAEPGEMALFRVPLNPDHVLSRILVATRDLVPLAMLRGLERLPGAPIGLHERLRSAVVDAVANVLDDHASPSSFSLPTPMRLASTASRSLWYSSCRRIQSCQSSPSSRPFGAPSRIG